MRGQGAWPRAPRETWLSHPAALGPRPSPCLSRPAAATPRRCSCRRRPRRRRPPAAGDGPGGAGERLRRLAGRPLARTWGLPGPRAGAPAIPHGPGDLAPGGAAPARDTAVTVACAAERAARGRASVRDTSVTAAQAASHLVGVGALVKVDRGERGHAVVADGGRGSTQRRGVRGIALAGGAPAQGLEFGTQVLQACLQRRRVTGRPCCTASDIAARRVGATSACDPRPWLRASPS